jgi:calcineurin-like phosphoesterase family protein
MNTTNTLPASGQVFFTSDLHFGHANISEFCDRPFVHGPAGVDEMNHAIIENWNAQVDPEDTVWILGDLVMGKIAVTLPLLGELNGQLYLVPGNHDRCWRHGAKNETSLQRWVDAYSEYCTVVEDGLLTLSTGQVVPFSHFPYKSNNGDVHEHRDQRYDELKLVDRGGWLIHGHVHERWRCRGRQINVGIDAWGGRLVPQTEVLDIIAHGPQDLGRLTWER